MINFFYSLSFVRVFVAFIVVINLTFGLSFLCIRYYVAFISTCNRLYLHGNNSLRVMPKEHLRLLAGDRLCWVSFSEFSIQLSESNYSLFLLLIQDTFYSLDYLYFDISNLIIKGKFSDDAF